MSDIIIARPGRECESAPQKLSQHADNVSMLCGAFGESFGVARLCGVIGKYHDIGKASQAFQRYVRGEGGRRGEIDHSTAGAKLLWSMRADLLLRQLSALAIMSHHSNLVDCIDNKITSPFFNRTEKQTDELLCKFALSNEEISEAVRELRDCVIPKICIENDIQNRCFRLGLFARLLHSCLVDADRTDAASFARGNSIAIQKREYEWERLILALERYMSDFSCDSDINTARAMISDACKAASSDTTGVFRLAVPTGGGKTLASMRFALNHCKANDLDRIIYVLPYVTIIEQNANVIRRVFEKDGIHDAVLEHHSNIVFEAVDGDASTRNVGGENFDRQIIFTTSVQFLESFFGFGGSASRRMHNFSRACIVFDEVQSMPYKCMHMFTETVKFLTEVCGSSVVLCTATQPALDKLYSQKHRIPSERCHNIVAEEVMRYPCFDRVTPHDKTSTKLNTCETVKLVEEEMRNSNSCMIITNTKKNASALYNELMNADINAHLFYLSTSLCPAHRKKRIDEIRAGLTGGERIVLVSTSLIEAGVDISFEVVIRHLAGLDSVVQAAGRCNRNSELNGKKGRLIIIEPTEEHIDRMPYIYRGKHNSERILREVRNGDLNGVFSTETIDRYFDYSYNDNPSNERQMDYPTESNTTLFTLLSDNAGRMREYLTQNGSSAQRLSLNQSFAEANSAFCAIEQNTFGVICPYSDTNGSGMEIIEQISHADITCIKQLLRRAQMYSVNCYKNQKDMLISNGIIYSIHDVYEIYALSAMYYDSITVGMTDAPNPDGLII